MTANRALTRRYVGALYQLAAQAGETAQVREALLRLQTAARADARFADILRHPEVAREDKRALLLSLVGPEPSALIAGFLDVVLDKGRPEALPAAADMFTELADEAAGVVRAHVEVAWEPDEAHKTRLREALSRVVGAPVVTEFHHVPEVIGGARVRMAGRVIDGSLSGKAQRLVEHLRAL